MKLTSQNSKLFRRIAQLVLIAALAMLFLGADTDARFTKLGHQMMCMCGCNQILLECNHVGCTYSDRMRNELIAGLERGDSDSLVLQSFVQKYGNTVLAAPTSSGFNLVAWVTPFVIFALACGGTIWLVRAWNTRTLAQPVGHPNLAAEEFGIQLQRGEETDSGNLSIAAFLFSFEGTITRAQFWAYLVSLFLIYVVFCVIVIAMGLRSWSVAVGIYFIITLYPTLAVNVKRCHDIGRSGWFVLIALVPIASLWYFVEVGFLPRRRGRIKYDPDLSAALTQPVAHPNLAPDDLDALRKRARQETEF